METLIAASFDGFLEGAWNIGKVLIGLGFVIFVHELGHFLVAKACGVPVSYTHLTLPTNREV